VAYRFEASSLTGSSLGAIERFSGDRTVSFGLSRPTTCSFALRLDDELVDVLQRDPCRIRVYDTARSPSLAGHLDLIDDEEVAGEGGLGTVHFNCSDQWWLLAHRLIGKSRAGYSQGTALAPVERGAIVRAILDDVNASGLETGLRSNASVVAAGATYVGPWTFKPAAEAISELASTLDGFEWVIDPIEYSAGKVGDFKTYGVVGTYQEHAAFEYGHGRHNVQTYRSPRTRQTQANLAFSLPSGWPDNTAETYVYSLDTASRDKWLLVEDVVPGDLTVQLRQQLVAEHVRVRKEPRKLWTFEPILQTGDDDVRVPVFGVDYDIGDLVPLTIKVNVGGQLVTRFDGVVRVFQVDVTIDPEGNVKANTVVAGNE
jgi:hypothetical protein